MTNTERTYIAETLEQLMYRSAEEGYTGERDALTYAIINLNKTTWIPTAERLPEQSGSYLVKKKKKSGEIQTALGNYYAPNNQWTGNGNFKDVLAWMPLPDMYEEEGADGSEKES